MLETLQTAIIDRFDPIDFSPEVYEQVAGEGLKSCCLIPLVTRVEPLDLTIARTTEPSFTADDVEFLTQAAGRLPSQSKTHWHTTRLQNSKTSSTRKSSI